MFVPRVFLAIRLFTVQKLDMWERVFPFFRVKHILHHMLQVVLEVVMFMIVLADTHAV